MEDQINRLLDSLCRSKFRGSFHLNAKMKEYVREKGLSKIQQDAYELLKKRVGDANPKNDGRQTPMKQVHPVFIAQHACACCCRGCLYKWYGIEKGKELDDKEIDFIVNLLIKWIEKELSF